MKKHVGISKTVNAHKKDWDAWYLSNKIKSNHFHMHITNLCKYIQLYLCSYFNQKIINASTRFRKYKTLT